MAKRVFTEEERAEYREKAGIGVSTFYNFFASKEEYVYEVLKYRRKKIPELIRIALNGKEKAGPAETRTYLKMMIDERYSVFPSLTPEDEKRLLEMLPEQARPDLQKETETSMQFFRHMEGIRPDVNIPLVANLIKVYVLAAEGKEMLHQAVYEVTMERMRNLILYEIFGRTE